MDRVVYLAMSGASQSLSKQATTTQNLANASTPGYRAQTNSFRALWAYGAPMPTRVYVADSTTGARFEAGPLMQTGRDLDLAVQGKGWFTVQTDKGEGYTRDGSFQRNVEGTLVTSSGLPVLSDSGEITIPVGTRIHMGSDGTIGVSGPGNDGTVTVLGRLKVVNPDDKNLVRGDDGLFRTRDGQPAEANEFAQVASGVLEGSNVNAAEAMVDLIESARHFDFQMKMIQTVDENEHKASQILNLNG